MPQRPSPCHGTPSVGWLLGCYIVLRGVLGPRPLFFPQRPTAQANPQEFYCEALEITQHCQKKGFADSQNPIGKPRWIYDLG